MFLNKKKDVNLKTWDEFEVVRWLGGCGAVSGVPWGGSLLVCVSDSFLLSQTRRVDSAQTKTTSSLEHKKKKENKKDKFNWRKIEET